MLLKKYEEKRRFQNTPEPKAKKGSISSHPIFVIQEHEASHFHYDFRIEIDGVLKSWAVPKELPMDTKTKRLAVETEDHPLEYANFEGTIPKGEYGAGTVTIFDKGHFKNLDGSTNKLKEDYKHGHIKILLEGEKNKGGIYLKKFREEKNSIQWLIIKMEEENTTE